VDAAAREVGAVEAAEAVLAEVEALVEAWVEVEAEAPAADAERPSLPPPPLH